MTLPVNVDVFYDDDPNDATVKAHQQHHDTIHAVVNDAVTKAGDQTVTGLKSFVPSSAATVGLIVKAVASQTADLQQWQSSAGGSLARILSNGAITGTQFSGAKIDLSGGLGLTAPSNDNSIASSYWGLVLAAQRTGNTDTGLTGLGSITAHVFVPLTKPAVPGLILRSSASQTADLQQWQTPAGSTVTKVGPLGDVVVGNGTAIPPGPVLSVKTPAQKQATITTVSRTANVGTVTTAAAHPFFVGENVIINESLNGMLNGTRAIVSVPTATTFTVASVAADAAAVTIPAGNGTNAATVKVTGTLANIVGSAGSFIVNEFGYVTVSQITGVNCGTINQTQYDLNTASGVNRLNRVQIYPYLGQQALNVAGDNPQGTAGAAAASVLATFKAATGQTADITQWQNSAGTVLARVSKDGHVFEGSNRVYSAANPAPDEISSLMLMGA